jgi:hypothetical protein
MRRPYGGFLILSIFLTVLYFLEEKRPAYISFWDDLPNKLFFGIIYIALIFSILSFFYIYVKKSGR